MSAFEIYLIMQLDAVGTTLVWVTAICGMLGLVVGGVSIASYCDSVQYNSDDARQVHETSAKWFVRVLLIGGLCLAANTLLPSTKTAAAMFIVPHLTSPEAVGAIGGEAKEILDLAKQAFKERVEQVGEKQE